MNRKSVDHRIQIEGYTISHNLDTCCYEDAIELATKAAMRSPGKKVQIFAEVAVLTSTVTVPKITITKS